MRVSYNGCELPIAGMCELSPTRHSGHFPQPDASSASELAAGGRDGEDQGDIGVSASGGPPRRVSAPRAATHVGCHFQYVSLQTMPTDICPYRQWERSA